MIGLERILTKFLNGLESTSRMLLVARIFTALVTVLMFCMWTMWTFLPARAQSFFEIEALSTTGLNALKSDMGGLFLALFILILLGFFRNSRWFYSAAIISSCIVLNRIISLGVDGFTNTGLQATILELLIIPTFLFLARRSTIAN